MINPGDKWDAKIADQLVSAHLIVLLVSASFLNSKYIYANELNIALDRDSRGEARLVPIIIRKCDWEQELFARNNVLPLTDTRQPLAVSAWTDRDDAWTRVAKGLRNLLTELHNRPR